MACFFDQVAIADLRSGFEEVPFKRRVLTETYVDRNYRTDRAREYARHGFARRLKVLQISIRRVYGTLPPELDTIPSQEKIDDATIALHAFVLNIYGAIDNLAWIVAFEKSIRKADGNELGKYDVGFFPLDKKPHMRNGLSAEFRDYIDSLNEWSEYQGDYRHALAHRIPPYIPPYTVDPSNESRYQELNQQLHSIEVIGNQQRTLDITRELDTIRNFRPVIMHSFSEQARPIEFHAQMLADFHTVEELGQKTIDEIS